MHKFRASAHTMGGGVFLIQCENLTDLLNRDTAAYELFYALTPRTQELLQQRDIHSLEELHQAVADLDTHRRPSAF